jgi:hypothetical protein
MTLSEPSSRLPDRLAARPAVIQPWAISLVGVMAILVLLVAITL